MQRTRKKLLVTEISLLCNYWFKYQGSIFFSSQFFFSLFFLILVCLGRCDIDGVVSSFFNWFNMHYWNIILHSNYKRNYHRHIEAGTVTHWCTMLMDIIRICCRVVVFFFKNSRKFMKIWKKWDRLDMESASATAPPTHLTKKTHTHQRSRSREFKVLY